MHLILIFIFSIAFLEIIIRVIDKNCYSILPFYFDENHSSMLKNEEYCVKYKGHPYAIYKTNKFGIRMNNRNKDFESYSLLIGDSQALGYGVNFEDHFLYKYLNYQFDEGLEILAAPHNDLKSIKSFTEQNNFYFFDYSKVYFLINMGMDIDRYVFGWQKNWNNSNSVFELKLSKIFRIYPYIKNIYLKMKKYHFTFRPSINPYLDYLTDQESNYLIKSIIENYILFVKENSINNFEFIIIAPAWYIDKNQIHKYKNYYNEEEFADLENNYDYYFQSMKINIQEAKKIFKTNNINFKIIDNIKSSKDLFLLNNYHLNLIGHDNISNIL